MENHPIKISVVSYLNSTPFITGINAFEIPSTIQISLDIPSVCAQKLISDEIDIGLIPVAMIPSLNFAEIITNYCIGADGKVASVLLVSNSPIEKITTIIKDRESRTSVMLAKILANEYWKINPEWIEEDQHSLFDLPENTGAVIIGDRALQSRNQFQYIYDLAEIWKQMTTLPFVFACWVANKSIDSTVIQFLEKAFAKGMTLREEIAETKSIEGSDISTLDYLTNYIQYNLSDDHKKGLALFLEKIKSY